MMPCFSLRSLCGICCCCPYDDYGELDSHATSLFSGGADGCSEHSALLLDSGGSRDNDGRGYGATREVDEVDSSSRGLEGSSRRKNPKPQRSALTGFLKNFGTSSSNGTTAGSSAESSNKKDKRIKYRPKLPRHTRRWFQFRGWINSNNARSRSNRRGLPSLVRTEEQVLLDEILEETAANMIDLTDDGLYLSRIEVRERTRVYENVLNKLSPSLLKPDSDNSTRLLKDMGGRKRIFRTLDARSVNETSDFELMDEATNSLRKIMESMKVESKENIIAPFPSLSTF